MRTVTNKNIKTQNRKLILEYLLQQKQTSRQSISKDLHMSMPTVLQNLSELYEMGIIRDSGQFASTGGRKASVVSLVSGYRLALGVNITANHLELVILDLAGNTIRGIRKWVQFSNTETYFKNLANTVLDFVNEVSGDFDKIVGVGISVPGTLNDEEQIIVDSYFLKTSNISYSTISDLLPWPCHFINDANAAGLAEMFISKKSDTVVYLSLSNSVGGAIFVDGKLYKGLSNRSGEFGHMCIIPNGKPCYCGKRGCLDAYCSTKHLSTTPAISKLEPFFSALDRGDDNAIKIWDDYIIHLATALINIHMIFDCDIILGGFIGGWIGPYMAQINEKIAALDPFFSGNSYIRNCVVPRWVSAVGAALEPLKQFINDFTT